MKGLSILRILTCVLILDKTIAQWASNGISHSFTFYTANTEEPTITWSLKNKTTGLEKKLFQCSWFNGICLQSEDKFLELYSGNIIINASTFTSVFTIKSVTLSQHNTTWLSTVNRKNLYETEEYHLYVFDAPENPTCDDVTLLNENSIHIDCVTQKGYPSSVCLFYVITNESAPAEVKNGHINYTHEQDILTGYYKTTCSYTVSADFLGPGTHMFYVVMYPDITSTITEEMKNYSQYSTPIDISYPEAVLASDCKVNSYIKENETGHCTCYNKNSSFLPPHITWSTGESKFESKGESNNYTLSFTARRPSNENQSFRCIISNTLNWTTTITFQSQVLYGPDSVKIVINYPEYDVCDNSIVQIVGNCLVSESNPFATVYSIVNNSWTQLKPGTEKNKYMFTMPSNSTGIFNVSCYANNSVFGDISSLNSEYVTLKDSDIVFLIVNLVKEARSIMCSCDVWYESKCPKNSVSVKIDVLQSLSDETTENNVLAIGFGVAALVTFLVLLVGTISFFCWRKKQKHAKNSSVKKNSEAYSDLKESQFKDQTDTYETPNLHVAVSSKDQISSSEICIHPNNGKRHTSSDELGGFIVTDDVNVQENHFGFQEITETLNKNEEHPYDEVRDQFEVAPGPIQKNNPSYSNVQLN